jgi:hypothetical protein
MQQTTLSWASRGVAADLTGEPVQKRSFLHQAVPLET